MRITKENLTRYDQHFKSWHRRRLGCANALENWHQTEEAGAVQFYPVGGSPLEGKVKFSFTETPPASGDKGPENPSTISGVESIQVAQTNKNLASQPYHTPTSVRQGVTWTVNADGSVTANGTATANSIFYVCGIDSTNLRLPVGTKCFLSGCPSGGSYSSYFMRCSTGSGSTYISANDLGSGSVFTVSDSNSTVGVMIQITKGFTANNLVFYPQLEFGESKTEWEPFTRIRVTIPLGNTYYGGKIDLATGLMTVTWEGVEADRSTIANSTPTSSNNSVWQVTARDISAKLCKYSNDRGVYTFCNYFSYAPEGTEGFHFSARFCYFQVAATNSADAKTIALDLYDTAAANNNPIFFVYPLATPYTVQLSPLSLSALAQTSRYEPRLNTVYTDADSIQITYQKSPIRAATEQEMAILGLGGNV